MGVKAKPMQFMGHCTGCGKNAVDVRGGVEVIADRDDDHGDWLCCACADRLANKLQKAVTECRQRMARGEVYKDDRWQPGPLAPGLRADDA